MSLPCLISNFSRHQPTSFNPDNLLLSGLLGVSSAVVDNVPLVQATPSLEVKVGLYWDNGKSNGNYYNGVYIGVYYKGTYWDNGKENENYYLGFVHPVSAAKVHM